MTDTDKLTAHQQIKQWVQTMQHYPLEIMLPAMGMNFNTFMRKVGGLSAGRVAQGNLYKLRASTREKVHTNAQEWALSLVKEQGWPEEVGRSMLQSMPVCSNGREAGFAGLLHSMQRPGELQLPLSIGFGLVVDELLYSLQAALEADDCALFGQHVLQFLEQQKWSELEELGGKQFGTVVQEWRLATTWDAIQPLADKFLWEALHSFFAAADVEWGNFYFSGFIDSPSLPLVAPRRAEGLNLDEKLKPKQSLLRRPVRRLFELSATLIYRQYFKAWPECRPTVQQLAAWMNEDEEVVYNYLDGSKLLTFDDFRVRWIAMLLWMAPKGKQGELEQISAPNLLVLFASGWQATLIKRGRNKRIESFVYFGDEIPRHWSMYRKRWDSQLQRAEETLEWPVWLN